MKILLTPTKWVRVSEILDDLLERSDVTLALVDERCGGDGELRQEVLRLLSADRRAGNFLSEPAVAFAVSIADAIDDVEPLDDPPAPEIVGPWRILREIGRGGMGVVYLAERTGEQFRQLAALKLVRAGVGSEEILARFRRERQILARLNHPNIARLLDGGRAADGRPFLAMEYVEGQTLTAYCNDRGLGVVDRLRLFLSIANAVTHAHAQLVVHRDLKPSNILVTASGELRLLDFGIAKLLAEDDGDEGALTRTGLPLMTPEYAAPEQLRGEAVSTATDVYALGLILYELLAGRHAFADRTPHRREDGTARAEPARPSLTAPNKALRRQLNGDLDTIIMMALRDDPQRRYPSVEALARDIDRHLAGLPVSARPDTIGYRARKFVRRHRWGVGVSVAALLILLTFAATMAEQVRRTARQRDRAERVSKFLVELFTVSSPFDKGGDVTAREILDRGAQRIESELASEPETQADLMDTMGRVYWTIGSLAKAERIFTRAVDLQRRAFGDDDPRMWVSMNALGNVVVREGRLEAGTRLLSDTLVGQRRVLGADHTETLRTMNDLAFWLGVGGRFNESELLHRQVLANQRRLHGPRSGSTVWPMNDLGLIVMRQGRYEEAEALIAEALATWRRVQHPANADLFREALLRGNLASVYQRQRRFAEAEKHFVDALSEIDRVMGPENPHALSAQKDLAAFYAVVGRPGEAEKLLLQNLDRCRRIFGPRHVETLQSAYWLGVVYRDQGRLAEAQALQQETLAIQREELGPEYPDTLVSIANLARILGKRGRLSEAESLLRQVLDAQRRRFGVQFPDAAETMFGLACLANLGGRRAEALDLLAQAVESGYIDTGLLTREIDLIGLRGDAHFARLASSQRPAHSRP
jgi:tetratricopeptide (TPR) repeat protein